MQLVFLFLFAFALAFTMWGRNKYRKVYDAELKNVVKLGITGSEVAERILRENGMEDVKVVSGHGLFTDFYDPFKKRLTLAPQHFNGSTFTAIGIAAHEAGHALQHRDKFKPLFWRLSAIRATYWLSLPMVLVGAIFILIGMGKVGAAVLAFGWPVIALYNLSTVPTEMDATLRAKKVLEKLKPWRGIDERLGIEKVMNAACSGHIEGVFSVLSWVGSLVLPAMGPAKEKKAD